MSATRRRFLHASTVAGTGLLLGFSLPELRADDSAVFEPNAYIRIAPDNTITLWVIRSEMGQGVRTNLPAALADELEVDIEKVRVEQAMPGGRFAGIRLRTSGSGSSSGTFMHLREAGATAREMLIAAGAASWSVEAATCKAQLGAVIHMPTNRQRSYGSLASSAARLPVPPRPRLKSPSEFRYIGKPALRQDRAAIVSGKSQYGLDIQRPGMVHAVVARCPYLGGKASHFETASPLAVPGVRSLVPVNTGIATGVAVVADTTWAAMKGRDALRVEWDAGPNRTFNSDDYIRQLYLAADQKGYPIRNDGDAAQALTQSPRRIDAVYRYSFQAHAPMEVMNCTADYHDGECEIWAPTQTPETAAREVADLLKISPEKVRVHVTLLGGGFGRRLFSDFVHEAAEISKAIGKPVQVTWPRSDDLRYGYFQPASVEHLAGAVDSDGKALAYWQKSVSSDLSMFGRNNPPEDPNHYANDGSPWGSCDNPYNFPHLKADYIPIDCPVPTGPWRAVEYPATVFARESFVDEMALLGGKDPIQFRIDLLQPGNTTSFGGDPLDRSRMIRVLEVAREKTGWGTPLPGMAGRKVGRGLAINVYHGDSYIAEVAEVSLAPDGSDFWVHKIHCVVDCGLVINPTGLEGQVESGITWGLSAALRGRIDFKDGAAVQTGFHDFHVLRMNEMPAIETHAVPTDFPPGGFGEHPVPPVAPAVANAIFAATGKRLRNLPFNWV
ncbi:MAG TPA: molybdopterin cofactor-binding domain-containing protein [Terriglobales bacterium]|nr:molybdopterin cofactor-binding domain-containing protein [Terriglobales bacterium]